MNLIFPHKNVLDASLACEATTQAFNQTSYGEVIDCSLERNTPLVPLLCLDNKGELNLSIAHTCYYSEDIQSFDNPPQVLRLCITIDQDMQFDPSKHLKVSLVSTCPIANEIKIKVPTTRSLTDAVSVEAVNEILCTELPPEKGKTTVRTFTVIPPKFVNKLIEDKAVTPSDYLNSFLTLLRENNLSRGPNGGKISVNKLNKSVINFLCLAHEIHSKNEDQELTSPNELTDTQLKDISTVSIEDTLFNDELHTIAATFKTKMTNKLQILQTARIPRKIHETTPQTKTGEIDHTTSDNEFDMALKEDEGTNDNPIIIPNKPKTTTKAQDPQSNFTNIQQTAINEKILSSLSLLSNEMIAAANKSVVKEDTKGFNSWPEATKIAYLILAANDPLTPKTEPDETICKLLKYPSSTKIAARIKTEHPTNDWKVDIAMWTRIKVGDISMNEVVILADKQVRGLSPFSCGTESGTGTSAANRETLLTKIEVGMQFKHLENDEIRALSTSDFFIPTNHMALLSVIENWNATVSFFFSTSSWISKEVKNFHDNIKNLRTQVGVLISNHGSRFTCSLLTRLHTELAIVINSTLVDPLTIEAADFNLRPLLRTLRDGTFLITATLPFNTSSESNTAPKQSLEQKKRGRDRSDTSANDKKKQKIINPNNGTKSNKTFKAINLANKALREAGIKCPSYNGSEACLKWFIRGDCDSNCERKATHIKLVGDDFAKFKSFKKKLEDKVDTANTGT